MRIIVLATKPLDVRSGDALRFVNVAQHLRPAHRFELLCFSKPGQVLDSQSAAVFERASLVPCPSEVERSWPARLSSALSPGHFMPRSEDMRRAIARVLAAEPCDLIFDIGGLMLQNLPPSATSPPVVVDSIDEPGITLDRALRRAQWHERPRLWRTKWLYGRVNGLISARVQANVYSSDIDAAYYARRFPRSRVESIPNGVDVEHYCPGASPPDPNLIAFEGNMGFAPNVDAARHLATEIMPLLWRSRPSVRLQLIGRDPAAEVRALASERVEVTGTVADVREQMRRASVFVCPMRMGAGIKNKVLQALALGLPIVATSESTGGLEVVDGEHALIADDPASFAAAVTRLLESAELRAKLGSNSRRLAVTKYTWKIQALRFEQLFRSVAVTR